MILPQSGRRQATLQPFDIFTMRWRTLALARALYTYKWIWPLWWLFSVPLIMLWRIGDRRAMVAVNKRLPRLSWLLHLHAVTLEVFEADFRQAWQDELTCDSHGDGEVVDVIIFVGNESMSVPVLFNKKDPTQNKDADTFKQLLMWYSWMQYKRGFGEVILPRKLVRIDKVKMCMASATNPVLGDRVKAFDLGRNASSNVVNFVKPDIVDLKQYRQTTDMLSNVEEEGLEFVRAWDRNKVSMIALIPFLLSLLSAIIWIVVSTTRYAVDAQVAVQTGFTIAAFVVTAGALLIALFAFLDDRTG